MSTINSNWLAMQMADLLEGPLNTNSVVTAGVSRDALRLYVEAIQQHSSDRQEPTYEEIQPRDSQAAVRS